MTARSTRAMAMALPLVLAGLAACGGGGQVEPAYPSAARMSPVGTAGTARAGDRAPLATSVRLEGCVVDRHHIPAEARVEALQADGRAVAHTDANAQGIFHLRVPPDQEIRVRLFDRDGSAALLVRVAHHDFSVAACLMDETRE